MELNTLSLTQAISGLSGQKFTSLNLVNAAIEQIEKTDPTVHAFLATCFKDARDKASVAGEQIKSSQGKIFSQKPLLGIPISIKDNFNTKGLVTTASSNVLKNYLPPFDATMVKKLKEAGSIILGKNNMDAFAHGSSTETSDFGPTKNPWDKSRLPGGSSGGCAAAVAADQVIFSLGSETAGSVRQPAAWCGVTGFKPTYGRLSRFGLISMASSTDCPGPLTKSVADAKIVYEILAGFDPLDATTTDKPLLSSQKTIEGLRVGLPKEYFRADSQKGINQTVLSAAKELEKLGATLVDLSLFDPQFAISVYTILQRSEVSSNLARFDGLRFGASRTEFNAENKRRIILGTHTLSAGYYDAYYKKAQQIRTLIVQDFWMAFQKVDLILGPTSPTTALPVGASSNQAMFGEIADALVEPSSIAGLPGLNLPCGFIDSLPVGLQLIAPQWEEDLLFLVGQAFQDKTDHHLQKPSLS